MLGRYAYFTMTLITFKRKYMEKKEKFFNWYVILMLLLALVAIWIAIFSNPVNFSTICWAFATSLWCLLRRDEEMKRQAAEKLAQEMSDRHQALSAEHLKLVKEHEATAKDTVQSHKRIQELSSELSQTQNKVLVLEKQLSESDAGGAPEPVAIAKTQKPAKTRAKKSASQIKAELQGKRPATDK